MLLRYSLLMSATVLLLTSGGIRFVPGKKSAKAMVRTVREFAGAVNEQNMEKLSAMMTDGHRFIDPAGNETAGRDKMMESWKGYFLRFPDYRIEIHSVFSKGDTIAVFGYASGTYKGLSNAGNTNFWRLPACWKAVVKGEKIALWQVYADTKAPLDIIARNSRQEY